MKQHYFVKFDPQINQLTGCYRATLILSTLEYWFQKKPDGFYKFIEACPHRLYKSGDSWTEQLDCDRKSFASSFDRIAVRYKSRRAYEKAEDKFQGKMYASIYDRNTNQTYFARNHDLANKILADLFPTKKNITKKVNDNTSKPIISVPIEPLRNGKSSRSYKEAKSSSLDLSKDKSHASDEIIKKMIGIWTALVEEGGDLVKLSKTTIPFLKKAFTDKFDNCLEKWKKYCYDIASSRFLMGEKNSFKAKLDWALLFKNIEKILDGQYGIGDRVPKVNLASQADLKQEISSSGEAQEIKDFRTLCLETAGNAKYISYFKNLDIEFREGGSIALISPHKFAADDLERNCYSYLRLILQGLNESLKTITVLSPGETRGRIVERKRGGGVLPCFLAEPTVEDLNSEEILTEGGLEEEEALPEVSLKDMLQGTGNFPGYESIREDSDFLVNMVESREDGGSSRNKPVSSVSLETKELRTKLRKTIPPKQFPGWLDKIEVEGISQDGKIVVTLGDSLAVGWCRSRFSREIFQSAESIWSGVNSLVIREKVSDNISLAIENLPEKSENVSEKSTLEQAIQSLLSACSPGKISEALGMHGNCQTFG